MPAFQVALDVVSKQRMTALVIAADRESAMASAEAGVYAAAAGGAAEDVVRTAADAAPITFEAEWESSLDGAGYYVHAKISGTPLHIGLRRRNRTPRWEVVSCGYAGPGLADLEAAAVAWAAARPEFNAASG